MAKKSMAVPASVMPTEPIPTVSTLPVAYIPTVDLIRSKKFRKYQIDFLRALLPKDRYTVAEATKIVEAYFKVDKKEAK